MAAAWDDPAEEELQIRIWEENAVAMAALLKR